MMQLGVAGQGVSRRWQEANDENRDIDLRRAPLRISMDECLHGAHPNGNDAR